MNQESLTTARSQVEDLVVAFERGKRGYKSASYKEAQVRVEFINPFFEALGWDVYNKQHHYDAYKEVIHEDAIKVKGGTRAPDYCFRIGSKRMFFVEAKKPFENLHNDPRHAYQLRRYGWSSNLSVSLLTDFEELSIYDCRIKPRPNDKVSTARVGYFNYRQYLEHFDDIYHLFGRTPVFQGALDRYARSNVRKRGTAPVDEEFLKEIEQWREILARNIALRNKHLDVYQLNEAVQKTIDRIIFLRICEDRNIERQNHLLEIGKGEHIYAQLVILFDQAEERYNSGLFHFEDRKDNSGKRDTFTRNLSIDDKVLKGILTNLYYPESPYEFSMISADILGQVYEQFLGKVIRLTPIHQAKIEEKPEVRKAGGVYYTPAFIVDYIVEQTVGRLCNNKSPKQIKKIKILDPACGSGSFLLDAYQKLIDYCRDWYLEKGQEKHPDKIYQGHGGQWFLTTAEKKEILLNCIYGVDIDSQAVEVTKLNLLLKALENESSESIEHQMKLYRERALPNLGENIRCGNSLIGSDYYNSFQNALFDDALVRKINTFDWNKEFSDILTRGGFDVVIGNPPYVRQETLGADFKKYAKSRYQTYVGTADLYTYFIEKGMALLKDGGYFSYIVANKWMRTNYGKKLRNWLSEQYLLQIIDFGDLPVFKKATTYPCILVFTKGSNTSKAQAANIEHLDFNSLDEYVNNNQFDYDYRHGGNSSWSLASDEKLKLLEKLKSNGIPLGEYVEGKIFRGVLTGLNKAFVIDAETRDRLITEDPRSAEIIKPFLFGRDIKRYQKPVVQNYLVLFPRGFTTRNYRKKSNAWSWLESSYPSITSHLKPFEISAKKRFDQGDFWWELRACDYYSEFEKPKIVYPNILKRPEFLLDFENLYTNQKCFIISSQDYSLLAVLNSKVTYFWFNLVLPKLRGGFFEPSYAMFQFFPVPPSIIHMLADDIQRLVERRQNLSLTNNNQKDLIEIIERQIDQLVYQLYNLTPEEIAIVESTVK